MMVLKSTLKMDRVMLMVLLAMVPAYLVITSVAVVMIFSVSRFSSGR